MTHPFADAEAWAGDTFLVDGPYLGARQFAMTIERDGLTMTFDGTAYPLEDYAPRSRQPASPSRRSASRRR